MKNLIIILFLFLISCSSTKITVRGDCDYIKNYNFGNTFLVSEEKTEKTRIPFVKKHFYTLGSSQDFFYSDFYELTIWTRLDYFNKGDTLICTNIYGKKCEFEIMKK